MKQIKDLVPKERLAVYLKAKEIFNQRHYSGMCQCLIDALWAKFGQRISKPFSSVKLLQLKEFEQLSKGRCVNSFWWPPDESVISW